MAPSKRNNVSELRSHLGYHLRALSNAVSLSFSKKLEASGVTVAEWVILREMYSKTEPISPSDVAKMSGLTRGAVSKLIERLLYKDLVKRKDSSTDRRFQEIELTPTAVRLVPTLARLADKNDAHFFSVLSKSEKNVLIEVLQKVSDFHRLKTSPIK